MPKLTALELEVYESIFKAEKRPNPETAERGELTGWLLRNIDSDHGLAKSVARLAQERDWTTEDVFAFIVLSLDSTLLHMQSNSLIGQVTEMLLAGDDDETPEVRTGGVVSMRRPGDPDPHACEKHPEEEISECTACQRCVDDLVATRPDGMNEREARELISKRTDAAAMDLAGAGSSSARH